MHGVDWCQLLSDNYNGSYGNDLLNEQESMDNAEA